MFNKAKKQIGIRNETKYKKRFSETMKRSSFIFKENRVFIKDECGELL